VIKSFNTQPDNDEEFVGSGGGGIRNVTITKRNKRK